jgi:hypothetical protein
MLISVSHLTVAPLLPVPDRRITIRLPSKRDTGTWQVKINKTILLIKHTFKENSVKDPDPHGSALIWLSLIRIRTYIWKWECGSGFGYRAREFTKIYK